MAKEKMNREDEVRLAKNGPQPQPVSADDYLSTEHDVLVDEIRNVTVDFGGTSDGIPRVSVMPIPGGLDTGGPPRGRTPMDFVNDQVEAYHALRERALAECPPPIIEYVTISGCCAFGPGALCVKAACPSYAQAGDACRIGKMVKGQFESSRTWPTPAEYEAMPVEARPPMGDVDHEKRLTAIMARYKSEAAAEKRAAAAETLARDVAIIEARREQARAIKIESVTPANINARREAAHVAATNGRR